MGVLVIIAAIVFFLTLKLDTYLQIMVVDSVSKAWVWNADITIDGKYTRAFYQSDSGTRTYTFTNLAPGTYDLTIKAASYTPKTIPVKIQSGKNVIAAPIELTGYEIPGIKEMFVYKDRDADNLLLSPRPLDKDGKGIGTHPCLNMWFGLRISVQMKNGVFVKEPNEIGSDRGEELFSGKLEWKWDPYPDEYYRYKITLPKVKVKKHNAPYNVYDYVIVLPDPRKIAKAELDSQMDQAIGSGQLFEIKKVLDGLGDKVTYYISSDWNQPALE